MNRCYIDLEVYSEVDIKSAPLDTYAAHPSTKILMAAYAFDDGPVLVWEADKGPSPAELRAAFRNPAVEVVAWNVNYERTVLKYKGLDIPLNRWLDCMVLARYAGLPGRLKECAAVPMLNVPAEEKTKSETLLINKFCKPHDGQRRDGSGKNAEDWQRFVEYCRRDVQTMRHILNWVEPRFPFPASEREIWILDQQINERGLPVDVEMARHGMNEARRILAASHEQMKVVTGLENPNSVQQLLPWLKDQGYRHDTLGKDILATYVVGPIPQGKWQITDAGREAVNLRLGAAKASVKKFAALVAETSPDGRLRQQFKYYGAHTGRWAGRGVQPQNLTRMTTDPAALKALLAGEPVESLAALSTCIRPCIRAPKGYKLVVADLSAIENRVLAWLSGSEDMLDIYRNGRDPYKEFATLMYRIEYEAVTKAQRQICKPAVLGCGYGLGGGQERHLQNGQTTKTGLWKYAESMGVELTQAEAREMVMVFRDAYPDVVFYWNYLEDAFLAAYKTKKRQQVGAIYFTATKEAVKIELPSGRCIHYLNPHAYRGAEGLKISFDGLRQGGWGRQSTWGGRLTENVVQAVARDVLAEGMKRAERDFGFTVVGHVHDELIALETIEDGGSVDSLELAMETPIEWAPGLPLAAEGWEGEFYMKA